MNVGRCGVGDNNQSTVERNRRMVDTVGASGAHTIEVWRDGKLFKTLHAKNTILLAGLDDMLNIYLRNGTPKTAWYMGIIDNAAFTTLANADTAASHAGWAENSSYSGGVRPTWSPAASSGQAVVNGTAVSFTLTANISARGVFIISDNTLGGTAGLLFSTSQFAEGVQVLHTGDVLKDTYTASLTPL